MYINYLCVKKCHKSLRIAYLREKKFLCANKPATGKMAHGEGRGEGAAGGGGLGRAGLPAAPGGWSGWAGESGRVRPAQSAGWERPERTACLSSRPGHTLRGGWAGESGRVRPAQSAGWERPERTACRPAAFGPIPRRQPPPLPCPPRPRILFPPTKKGKGYHLSPTQAK